MLTIFACLLGMLPSALASNIGGAEGDVESPLADRPDRPLGGQKILVILANFFDDPTEMITLVETADVVFNQVGPFLAEASYGKTWLAGDIGDIVGWYTLPLTTADVLASPGNLQQIADAAIAAADPDVDFSKGYRFVVIVTPYIPGFVLAVAAASDGTMSTNEGHYRRDIVFMVTGMYAAPAASGRAQSFHTLAHELIHGFDVKHAGALECGATTLADVGCSTIFYGDPFDVMGGGPGSHLSAVYKDWLGWLDDEEVLTDDVPEVTQAAHAGLYSIDPLELPSPGPKSLKIRKDIDDQGRATWYYLEYRQPIGFDDGLADYAPITSGALVHLGFDDGRRPRVLDMHPQTPGTIDSYHDIVADGALGIGETFEDPSGIRITPVAASGSLTVNVEMPTIDTSPPRLAVISHKPGQFVRGIQTVKIRTWDNWDSAPRVQIYVDDALLATNENPPYETLWDTTQAAEGSSHTFSAIAVDEAGHEGRAESVTVKVDNTGPLVEILAPGNGGVVTGFQEVLVTAEDEVGVANVELWVDFRQLGRISAAPYTFLWNTALENKGSHVLRAIARDLGGNIRASSPISVTVQHATNAPPVILPLEDRRIPAWYPFELTVTALDPDGDPVVLAALLSDGTGIDTLGATFTAQASGSGTFAWRPTPAYIRPGGYQLTFLATDGTTQAVESATLEVVWPGDYNMDGHVAVGELDLTIDFSFRLQQPNAAQVPFVDLNGNGDVEPFELQTVILAFLQSNSPEMLQPLDVDGNGVTTAGEVLQVLTTENQSPSVLLAVAPTSLLLPEKPIVFTVTATDSDGTIAEYAWDFGDGTQMIPTLETGASITHAYAQPGIYTVTVTATDNLGGSAVASIELTVGGTRVCRGSGKLQVCGWQ